MKILLMTGSYPPDICGVSDYSERLAEALEKAGAKVEVFTGRRWGLSSTAKLNNEIRRLSPDILHMQYPATGYGWRLGPQMLSLLQPSVITIHECSQSHIIRRLALYPFSLRAQKIIFTNQYEREYSERFAPWIRDRDTVIGIGSNIVPVPDRGSRLRNVVTSFGLIRPHKGLEEVIALGRLFKERSNGPRIRIIGTLMPGSQDYYAQLQKESRELPIEWLLGLNGEPLSHTLAETSIAYMPFPDGASERRGSLIALLANKAATITTRGAHTPPAMEGVVQFSTSPYDAVVLAEEIFNRPELMQHLQIRAEEYAAKFSWEIIAAEHIKIYELLVSQKTSRQIRA
jgi:glycosyltransferase involved in cell wall biosynthesis